MRIGKEREGIKKNKRSKDDKKRREAENRSFIGKEF